MTSSTPLMSRPRAATSVATRMSNLADLNAFSVTCTAPQQASCRWLASCPAALQKLLKLIETSYVKGSTFDNLACSQ